jgi:hypothetical protein
MTNKQALELINDCLENHYLNLRDIDKEESELFEIALEMTRVIAICKCDVCEKGKSNG